MALRHRSIGRTPPNTIPITLRAYLALKLYLLVASVLNTAISSQICTCSNQLVDGFNQPTYFKSRGGFTSNFFVFIPLAFISES